MKQPNAIDIIVSRNLKTLRRDKGWGQQDVAAKMGITYQQVQKYENGQNRITAGRLWQFSILYRVPIQNLFEG